MPTKKAQYLPRSDMDEYEIDDIGLEREMSEEETELLQFIDEFNSADPKSQVRVYEAKEPGPNTRGQLPLAYLFSFSPGQLTSQILMDKVSEEYGPGSYEAHIYAPHPQHDNRLKLARKIKFDIGQTREEKEESLPFKRRRTFNRGDSPAEIMRTFAEMMAQQNERTESLMREVLTRQQGNPAQDPIQAMAQMMGIMMQFQQMMPKPPPAPSLIDEVQKLAMLKEIFSDLGGGGETSDAGVWVKMLEKFGTPLVQALSGPPQGQIPGAPMVQVPYNPQLAAPQPQPQPMMPPGYMQNPQARPRDPNQAMAMPPPVQPQLAKPQNVPQNLTQESDPEMKANVDKLVAFAKMGIGAEMVAQQILNLTPEADEEKLYNFIADERCIEQMAALNPAVKDYPEFFAELRKTILAAFEEVSDEENPDLNSDSDGATLTRTAHDAPGGVGEGETGK